MGLTARFLTLALCLPLLTGFGPPAIIESSAAHAPVTENVLSLVPLSAPPTIGARAGILVDGATGSSIWQKQAEARLPVASTTKIMTALLALENASPDRTVRVLVGAAELPGHSVAGLRVGEQLPMSDALYALMLPSGNDAALAIAAAIDGSTEAFVARMNRRADGLGLRETRFVNPHGWDDAGHVSSARDMARLARAALERPDFVAITSTKSHTYRGQWVHQWTNLNQLLFRRSDLTGVKTGTSDAAGPSLVASARRGDRRAIAVLLNSLSRYDEADALLDYFFLGHAELSLGLPPSPFYRGLTGPPPRKLIVPAWQESLLWIDPYSSEMELAGQRVP